MFRQRFMGCGTERERYEVQAERRENHPFSHVMDIGPKYGPKCGFQIVILEPFSNLMSGWPTVGHFVKTLYK